jgi:hypothetical protein
MVASIFETCYKFQKNIVKKFTYKNWLRNVCGNLPHVPLPGKEYAARIRGKPNNSE